MPQEHRNGETEPHFPVDTGIIKRAGFLMIGVAVLFALLLLRILLYQTVDYDRYQKKVINQMTTQSEVLAKRGNIYDRNGVPLATSVTTYRVFISPSSIASEQSEKNQNGEDINLADLISKNLSDILGISYDSVYAETQRTRYLDRTIKKGVNEVTSDAVRAFIDQYGLQRMIYLEASNTRYYPYASLASHALGFAGSDGGGLYGLELSYNELLAGTNGRYITARDALGNEMPYGYEEYIEAQNGYHLTTTLDVFVQSALEEQLEAAYTESGGQNRAAGIVMNVNTGEVLGMAVYPSFDLNSPWTLDVDSQTKLDSSGLDVNSEAYSKLKQELLLKMWSNKTITESYIPGSTFKVITASMVLEEDVVQTTDAFTCSGCKEVLGHRIHCHKRTGHGALTFAQGIQQSCNPVLMSVGLKLGSEKFYNYLTAFGYREKTGIDLPGEGMGLMASESAFTDLDLAIYSFGQNFNVTLIQQITAVSAVANGGYLVTPHLLSVAKDESGNVVKSYETNVRRQVVSTQVCQTVSDILEQGVSGDGGAKNAYVAGYRIAAKTGTSEKKDAGNIGKYICSTIAYAPADNPQYAVVILVDEPSKGVLYGSVVAAPYVANVMERILPYLGVEAKYSESELENMTVTAPGCTGWTGSYAKKTYGDKMEVIIIGDEKDVVYKQYPEKGTVMDKETGKLILYTGSSSSEIEAEMVIVPDVTGVSAKAAMQAMINAGLNVRLKGTNHSTTSATVKVVSQSIEKGISVPRGTVVELRFLSYEDEDMGVVEEIEPQ